MTTPTVIAPIGRDFPSLLFACLDCLRNHLPWREVPSQSSRSPVQIIVGTVSASHNDSGVDCNLTGAKPGHKGMSLHRFQNCWYQVGREAIFGDVAEGPGGKGRSNKVMIFMDRQK